MLGIFAQFLGARLHHRMALFGIARHHDVFSAVFLVGGKGARFPRARLHHRLAVCHARAEPEEDRCVKLLRELKGRLGKIECLG